MKMEEKNNLIEAIKNMEDNYLIIFSGASCSGKTTLSKELCDNIDALRISTDELREQFNSNRDSNYFQSENHVWAHLFKHTKENLNNNKNVVIDATMLNRKIRKKVINTAKDLNVKIISIFCETDLNTALERNKNRSNLKEDYIKQQFNSIEYPAYTEGFDYIIKIEN